MNEVQDSDSYDEVYDEVVTVAVAAVVDEGLDVAEEGTELAAVVVVVDAIAAVVVAAEAVGSPKTNRKRC